MSKIDLNEFKSVVPAVKKEIRRTLKVDAGTQNTLDIVSVSRGYSSFHSVKFDSELPYFDLRANMGTRENPFFVTLDVGHFMTRSDADPVARELLKGCQQFQKWSLYRNGEKTLMDYETAPEPEKGLIYQIEVSGNTLSDVEIALEEVQSRIDNVMGFDRNESGSFSFQRAGEEYDGTEGHLEDINVKMYYDYVLMDDSGNILKAADDEEIIDNALEEAEKSGHPLSDKVLIKCLQVSKSAFVESASNESDTATYHVIGFNEDEYGHLEGNAGDMIEELKWRSAQQGLTFWLYEEAMRTEPVSDDATFLVSVSGKVLSAEKYALIDDNGIVLSSDDEQKIEETFNFSHDDLEDWEGTLREAYKITPEQVLKARNEESIGNFIVVSVNDSGDLLETHSGSPGFIVELCLTKAFQGRRLMFFKQVRSL